jgi:hypothetical protein
LARSADPLDVVFGDSEIFRLDELDELGKIEVVVVAQIEGGDGGIEEVFEECVGELWFGLIGCVCGCHLHAGIVAWI